MTIEIQLGVNNRDPIDFTIPVGAGGPPGLNGKSAYQLAVDGGYTGTLSEWLSTLIGPKGDEGKSAYDVAVDNGYIGTQADWILSLAPSEELVTKLHNDLDDLVGSVTAIQLVTEGIGEQLPNMASKDDLSNGLNLKVDKTVFNETLDSKMDISGTEQKPGTIYEGQDLNTFTRAGTWFNYYPVNPLNKPSGVNESFTLRVMPLPFNSLIQEIILYGAGDYRVIRRFLDEGSWTSWENVPTPKNMVVMQAGTTDFTDVANNTLIFVRET